MTLMISSIFGSLIVMSFTGYFFMIFAVIALFISVVTLAYSIKFFGPSFFGKFNPGKAKKNEGEVPTSMVIPQIIMAVLCIVFGILLMVAVGFIGLAGSSLLGDSIAALPDLSGNLLAGLNINFGQGIIASWNPIIILIGGVFCLLISLMFFREKVNAYKPKIIENANNNEKKLLT